ncbi:exocyst complex component EXO84A-like [Aristolochia californica]|uniref:exocyst complex component EXO84A-like n=1 Tax=Aristolochia californica TaxID=171875 RepID=UPI0035DF7A0A
MERALRFRFRDQGLGDSTESEESSTSETSFDTSIGDEDSKLESMTGKGIKHLCSELLELKKVSDDDFYRNVHAKYSAFLSIFDKVRSLEYELTEMKQHLSSQRRLVQDLMSDAHVQLLSEISLQSILEEDVCPDPCHQLETHTKAIIDTLDILLIEHRLDEALLILEREETNISMILEEEASTPDILVHYNCALSEMRRRLVKQFFLEAEHPRISAAEFQLLLSRLSRLGEWYRANILLVQYYRRHLARGVHALQCSRQSLHETYITEHAKLLFSMISQAVKSYILLYGEMSLNTSELLQWAWEETESFAHHVIAYVDSVPLTTAGLSLAAEAVQNVTKICSLLDSQGVLLTPHLMKLIQPCMERLLKTHLDNLKEVIRVFVSVDNWILREFFVLGLRRCRDSSCGIEEKPEYYLLTSSGRKLVTIIQAIVEDSSPLVILHMDSFILKGLADLFTEYVEISERSISIDGNATKKDRLIVNLATTLSQQLSVLTNVSTLALQIFPSIAKSIFQGHRHSDYERLNECAECSQNWELKSWIITIKEAAKHLRHYFCEQFVSKVLSPGKAGHKLRAKFDANNVDQFVAMQDPMPSDAFQELYLQVRLLERFAKDICVGEDLVAEDLLREVMEAVFDWLKNDQEFWTVDIESSIPLLSASFSQFALDIEFLLQVARVGGYLSERFVESSVILMSRMETAFLGAGLGPNNLRLNDEWTINAAKAAIGKLPDTQAMNETPPLIEGLSMCDIHGCEEEIKLSDEDSCFSVYNNNFLSEQDDSTGLENWKVATEKIVLDVNNTFPSQVLEQEDSADMQKMGLQIIIQEGDCSSDQIDTSGLEPKNANDAEAANLSIENEGASSVPHLLF